MFSKNRILIIAILLSLILGLFIWVFYSFFVPMKEKSIYYGLKNQLQTPLFSYKDKYGGFPSNMEDMIASGVTTKNYFTKISDIAYKVNKYKWISFEFKKVDSKVIISSLPQYGGAVKAQIIIFGE